MCKMLLLSRYPIEIVVYGYSSDILGFIVEKISGQTLEKYLSGLVTV